jgi:hypothetical protein
VASTWTGAVYATIVTSQLAVGTTTGEGKVYVTSGGRRSSPSPRARRGARSRTRWPHSNKLQALIDPTRSAIAGPISEHLLVEGTSGD